MLHRTFIHAPGNQAGGERFELSARMLEVPQRRRASLPPDWVPRDLATYAAVNVDTKNAFENSKTLVNQVVGDEVFEDVLESIKTDENGPQIDIRRDLIGYLGNRVTMISDLQLPITPKSERMLFAVDTKDEKHLAKVIRDWMETDPDTRRREIAGHVVWEIVDEKAELPMITIENSPLDRPRRTTRMEEEEERALPPNSAVTVAYGQLFVATHIDILTKVLTEFENGPKLADSADYQRVQARAGRDRPARAVRPGVHPHRRSLSRHVRAAADGQDARERIDGGQDAQLAAGRRQGRRAAAAADRRQQAARLRHGAPLPGSGRHDDDHRSRPAGC